MVVISLIVVISTIALVGYSNAITRAREAVLKEDLFRMRDAIDQYYADKQQYPAALETLVAEGYLRAVPLDPFTSSVETWQPILAELDPGRSAGPGGLRCEEQPTRAPRWTGRRTRTGSGRLRFRTTDLRESTRFRPTWCWTSPPRRTH